MTAINRSWSRQWVLDECAAWPDPNERARWIELFADEHAERPWVRETAYQNAGVYTRYFLLTGETEVTPHGLKVFITLCERGAYKGSCTPRTIAGYVAAIYKTLRLLHPDRDYRALAKIVGAMLRIADRTPKRRAAAVADAVDLERFARDMIERGRRIWPVERLRGAMLFRTGLFILMGLYMPERLRAIASLAVAQVKFDTRRIVFRPVQTKNKRQSEREIPESLVPLMREWLEMRAGFQPDHGFFWISLKTGRAAASATLYAALRAETSDPHDFRAPVTPHLLRNTAAEFIVRHAPEKAPLVSTILTQRSPKLAREYTNGAGTIEASREAAGLIMNSGVVPKLDRRRGPKKYKRGKRVLTPPIRPMGPTLGSQSGATDVSRGASRDENRQS